MAAVLFADRIAEPGNPLKKRINDRHIVSRPPYGSSKLVTARTDREHHLQAASRLYHTSRIASIIIPPTVSKCGPLRVDRRANSHAGVSASGSALANSVVAQHARPPSARRCNYGADALCHDLAPWRPRLNIDRDS